MTTMKISHLNESQVADILRDHAKRRKYLLISEKLTEHDVCWSLYNRKPESLGFLSFLEIFVSRKFVSGRMRINLTLDKIPEGFEINISGDVLMAEMNIIDPDAAPTSISKVKEAMRELLDEFVLRTN